MFPVHQIAAGFRLREAVAPTYLVVFRNREDEVGFLELSAATARLLELVRDNTSDTAATLLLALAGELGLSPERILEHGRDQFRQLVDSAVVLASQF